MQKKIVFSTLILLLMIITGISLKWNSLKINNHPIPKGLKLIKDKVTPEQFYISYNMVNILPLQFKIISTNHSQEFSLLADMTLTSEKLINVKSSTICIKNGKDTKIYNYQWGNYYTNKYIHLFYEKTEVTSNAFIEFVTNNLKEDSQVTIIFRGDVFTMYEYLDDVDIKQLLKVINFYQVLIQ